MGILKFSLLFFLSAVILVLFGSTLESIFTLFGASINYISTGNIGTVINEIIGFVGWALDLLFLGTTTTFTTSIGGIEIYSLSWLFTFVRVIFGLVIAVVIVKLILDRS